MNPHPRQRINLSHQPIPVLRLHQPFRYPYSMSNELWSAVDEYIVQNLLPTDSSLAAALEANSAANLPSIDVAPNQGKLLHLLARMQQAGRILEIGTLGGYSTIWLARALPASGHLISLEVDPHHAEVARANVARAGLSSLVDIRIGPALESLSQLQREGAAPFDLIFIDADKPNNALISVRPSSFHDQAPSSSSTTLSARARSSMPTTPMSGFRAHAVSSRLLPPAIASTPHPSKP
jgi:hypothetical protein